MANELQRPDVEQAAAPMPSVYTLVAYRPNGVDTCRGCVMARSDSDIALYCFSSPEELTNTWARLRLSELGTGYEVSAVEYTLLVNGMDDDSWWRIHAQANPELDVPDAPHYELRDQAEQKYQVLLAQKKQQELEAKQALERAQLREREQAAAQALLEEQRLYAQLHQKYGSPERQ